MRRKDQLDWPFTKREWRHLTGTTAADWFAYASFLLAAAPYFCPDSLGDFVLSGLAFVASMASFIFGWQHDPECSDVANAMSLVSYPLVPLITILAIAIQYLIR